MVGLNWVTNSQRYVFHSMQFYQFTYFAMSLNEIPPDCKPPKTLCPTDSRLRPDVRKLESGDLDGAAAEKTRLEEKQRDTRKGMKSRKEEWTAKWVLADCISKTSRNDDINWECIFRCYCRWFTQGVNPETKLEDWMFKEDYWNRNYHDVDIF